MKHKKGFGVISLILIIVGVLIVGGGAYYFGKSTNKISTNLEDKNILTEEQQNNSEESVPEKSIVPTSPCASTATPSLTIISPNGGETYTVGQQITVKWKNCNINQSVGVTLSGFPYPNDTQFFVGNWVAGPVGSQIVTIPNTAQSGKYTINISTAPESSPSAEDWSDNFFTINSISPTIQTGEWGNDINGQHLGYIKSVFPNPTLLPTNNPTYSLKIDYIQMNDCNVGPEEPESCNNGFKIINNNPLIRNFSILSAVNITTISKPTGDGLYSSHQPISINLFKSLFQNDSIWSKYIPFWITLNNGVVTKITEQYLP